MYRDALKVPDYAIPAIATLTQQGLVTNYPDPRVLAPTAAITKSELAVLIYQALAYQKKLPALGSLYTINPNRQLWDRELMQITRLEVSISKRKVTAFHGEIALKTYPVAVGKEGWSTPIGNHRVLETIEYPAWQNPFTGDIIPSKDPENPLGDRWIGFWTNGKDWSGFHGTPNRDSVGTAASHGPSDRRWKCEFYFTLFILNRCSAFVLKTSLWCSVGTNASITRRYDLIGASGQSEP